MAHDLNVIVRRDTTEVFVRRLPVTVTAVNFMAKFQNNTDDSELHCEQGDLLGPLGLLVQGLLAVIAFSALICESLLQLKKLETKHWDIYVNHCALHFITGSQRYLCFTS